MPSSRSSNTKHMFRTARFVRSVCSAVPFAQGRGVLAGPVAILPAKSWGRRGVMPCTWARSDDSGCTQCPAGALVGAVVEQVRHMRASLVLRGPAACIPRSMRVPRTTAGGMGVPLIAFVQAPAHLRAAVTLHWARAPATQTSATRTFSTFGLKRSRMTRALASGMVSGNSTCRPRGGDAVGGWRRLPDNWRGALLGDTTGETTLSNATWSATKHECRKGCGYASPSAGAQGSCFQVRTGTPHQLRAPCTSLYIVTPSLTFAMRSCLGSLGIRKLLLRCVL